MERLSNPIQISLIHLIRSSLRQAEANLSRDLIRSVWWIQPHLPDSSYARGWVPQSPKYHIVCFVFFLLFSGKARQQLRKDHAKDRWRMMVETSLATPRSLSIYGQTILKKMNTGKRLLPFAGLEHLISSIFIFQWKEVIISILNRTWGFWCLNIFERTLACLPSDIRKFGTQKFVSKTFWGGLIKYAESQQVFGGGLVLTCNFYI